MSTVEEFGDRPEAHHVAELNENDIDPKRFQNIFETIHEPLLAVDNALRVKIANPSFYRTFGVTAEETENHFIYELGNGQWNIPKLKKLLEEIIPRNESFIGFEVEHDFDRIGKKTMILNARRIKPGNTILLAIEDITERKKLENELKRANVELEHFAFIASHDLKEPLRTVSFYAQLLAKHITPADKVSTDFLGFIQHGTKRMSELVDALLIHARVGHSLSAFKPVNCDNLISIVLEDLRKTVDDNRIKISLAPLPIVNGNEVQLRQLFQNLIGNAIKFRREENPEVSVSVERTNRGWKFHVKDNGIGIENKFLNRIFGIFQRGHARNKYPGSGIGLSLCKTIVENHGGTIWVESTSGIGSSFYFTLPTKESESGKVEGKSDE